MERELWKVLEEAIRTVEVDFVDDPRYSHSTGDVVRVYLWAALHERSVVWACAPQNWPPRSRQRRPRGLPDQSTMSRRSGKDRPPFFDQFLERLAQLLSARPDAARLDLKRLDGKPLLVANHSKDPDATWGRGSRGKAKGYKLHALWGTSILPERSVVTPLNVDERVMALRLLRDLLGAGYVLADGNYDAAALFHLAWLAGYQLLAPRDAVGAGLGHRRQRPARLRSIQLLERRVAGLGEFGPALLRQRGQIERRFAHLCGGVGALTLSLPPFVRRIWRVRAWVQAKQLIFAARMILRTKQKPAAA